MTERDLRDAFALRAFAHLVRSHKLGTDHRISIGLDAYALADGAMKARQLAAGGNTNRTRRQDRGAK